LRAWLNEWDFLLGKRYDEKEWREGTKDHHMVKMGDLWGKYVKRT